MKIQNRSHTKSHRTSLCSRLKEFMTTRFYMFKMVLEAAKDQRTIQVTDEEHGWIPLNRAVQFKDQSRRDRIIAMLKARGAKTSAELKD